MNQQAPTNPTRPAISLFRNRQSAIRSPHRRGILLLVVLSLLVLFLLVGTSFITSSNNHRLTSKTLSRPYEPATNPLQHTDLLDQTLNQLVRDTSNPYSSLAGHSLLNDLYGDDGVLIGPGSGSGVRFVDRDTSQSNDPTEFNFLTASATWSQLNDAIELQTGNQFFWAAVIVTQQNSGLRLQEDYYKGRVFTLLEGPAAGRSARVMRYFVDLSNTNGTDPIGAMGLFYLMLIDSDRNFSTAELEIDERDFAVINGQPFNGTGAGYDPNAIPGNPRLSLGDPNGEVALQPNYMFSPYNPSLGGYDESYDAPDFQNMALAWTPVESAEAGTFGDPILANRGLDDMIGTDDDIPLTIPSFHRPALINSWKFGVQGDLSALPNLLRKILLRPNWIDHPNFTGSNTEYEANRSDPNAALNQMIYGPWDVDNDGDLRRDSQWIDAGLPVMEGPQGVLVKPLVAILCIDLDGRLNLNAHGSTELARLRYGTQQQPIEIPVAGFNQDPNRTTAVLARGQAFGPAEIHLQGVLATSSDSSGDLLLQKLLLGGFNAYDAQPRIWSGRYGPVPGAKFPGVAFTDPNNTNPNFLGIGYDLLAQLKQQGYPSTTAGGTNDPNDWLGNFATPLDLHGRYPMALNSLGQPVYETQGDPIHLSTDPNFDPIDLEMNSPYELNLSRLGPHEAGTVSQDGPFTVAELERILRAFDKDASKLPARLWDLANSFMVDPLSQRLDMVELQQWRALFTTDSFDIPVANVTIPEWMRNGPDRQRNTADDFSRVMNREPVNLTFADLLEYRVRLGLGYTDPTAITTTELQEINQVMRQLLSPELAAGGRFDLNRPFGNGRDDNNNLIVDEPGEWNDVDNDGIFDAGEVEAPFWDIDQSRLATAISPAMAAFEDPNVVFGYFRDNIDRDGDGLVEAWEAGYLETVGSNDPNDRFRNGLPHTHLELVKLHNFRRQLYARHLYVLAMTLVDPLDLSGVPVMEQRKVIKEHAKRLAQWAINVADFKDPDSISTAFEYDINPFDGWGWTDSSNNFRLVDGDLATAGDIYGTDNKVDTSQTVTGENVDQGGVVWGAEVEGSSLKITETLAWHDRKTIDEHEPFPSKDEPEDITLEDDFSGPSSTYRRTTIEEKDRTYDQFERPQGAAFIELYNPWPQKTAANADVHAIDPNNGADLGINLAAFGRDPTEPDNRAHWSPAWRIMVYRNGGIGKMPENVDPNQRPGHIVWTDPRYRIDGTRQDSIRDRGGYRYDASMIPAFVGLAERSIYFTNFDPADAADGMIDRNIQPDPNQRARWDDTDGVGFYSSLTVPPVRPGRYMVVAGVDTETQMYRNNPNEYLVQFGFSQNRGVLLRTDPSEPAAVTVNGNDLYTPISDGASNTLMSTPSELEAAGLGLQSLSNGSIASVAVINSAVPNSFYGRQYTTPTMRRFTFSEPADGYPDKVYIHRSQLNPVANVNPATKKYGANRRQALDVPLDNRRTFDPGYLNLLNDPDRIVPINRRQILNRQRNSVAGIIGRPTSLNDGEMRLQLPDDKNALRTLVGFRWIYLQRLRNPTLPWNPERFDRNGNLEPKHDPDMEVNPYMTVDMSAVNLTVFNDDNTGNLKGERAFLPSREGLNAQQIRDERANGAVQYSNDSSLRTFASHQRGRNNVPSSQFVDSITQQSFLLEGRQAANRWESFIRQNPEISRSDPKESNLWSQEPALLWKNESGRADPNGRGLGFESVADTHNMRGIPDCTLGYLNEPYRDPNYAGVRPDTHKRIIPRNPFPSVVWHDRDFANSGEVLLVPAYSVDELTRVVTSAAMIDRDPNSNTSIPAPGEYADKTWNIPGFVGDGPFAHLMNFFRSELPDPDPNNPILPVVGMARVLDYLSVPSRYVGTETWLSPVQFGNGNIGTTADARYALQPPFNKVKRNRDPGRVNINTIGAGGRGAVWHAMFHGRTKYNGDPNQMDVHPAIDDDGFFSVRRGYGEFGNDVGFLERNSPTLLANPFRSASSAALVPISQMLRQEVEGTILRSMGRPRRDPNRTFPDSDPNQPTFVGSRSVPQGDPNGVPLLSAGTNSANVNVNDDFPNADDDFRNSDRNPYFRYDPIRRITSTTSNHSNVYAVWITIGFFEVTEAPVLGDFASTNGLNAGDASTEALYNRVYPEGYTFGREYGIETRSQVRLRQFAIVDRSIPVAFEPGENHNTEKAIRLKRRIE